MTGQLPLRSIEPSRSFAVPTFIKWAGGKASLLPQYAPLFPEPLPKRYFEPFLGSGAVFFYLGPSEALLSDLNRDLVNCYTIVKEKPVPLMDALRLHAREYNGEEYYYSVRARKPTNLSPVEQAARFVFLNKVGFNGLYRQNRRGEFNVPWGRYERLPKLFDERQIWAAHHALRHATIRWSSYQEVLEQAAPGDFVYLDPPYAPLSSTSSFTKYVSEDFDEEDQRRLAEVVAELTERRVLVMLSNSDTPLIRELYADFDIHPVMARRRINSNGEGRAAIRELVIRNY